MLQRWQRTKPMNTHEVFDYRPPSLELTNVAQKRCKSAERLQTFAPVGPVQIVGQAASLSSFARAHA